jgi:hypothetical protein
MEAEVRGHGESVAAALESQLEDARRELQEIKFEYERTCADYDESLKIRQVFKNTLKLRIFYF